MMKKKLSCIAVVSIFIGMGMLTNCSVNDNPSKEDVSKKADLVVYGKIFTAEGNQVVEAFAVKDGKYIYVGDKAGVEAYVEDGKTEVVDYSGKGLVMPGCGNGHAHYTQAYAMAEIGTQVDASDDVDKFLTEILPAAVKKAKNTNAVAVFGLGWNLQSFQENMPTRQQLDAICNDLPIFFIDDEGHKSLVKYPLLD